MEERFQWAAISIEVRYGQICRSLRNAVASGLVMLTIWERWAVAIGGEV